MGKRIWYVGHDSSKKLTNDHWKQRLGLDLPELEFKSSNGYSADADELPAAQLAWFASRPDFYLVDADTARTADAVPPLLGSGGGSTPPAEEVPEGETPAAVSAWAAEFGAAGPRTLTEAAGNLTATHQMPVVAFTTP